MRLLVSEELLESTKPPGEVLIPRDLSWKKRQRAIKPSKPVVLWSNHPENRGKQGVTESLTGKKYAVKPTGQIVRL